MRALMIGPEEEALIEAAIERARANPVPLEEVRRIGRDTDETVLTLQDVGTKRETRSIPVRLPIGYQVCISFEQQQVGLVRHLSISVETPGKLPHEAAVKMISEAFGIKEPDHAWWEEFDPGHFAVNVVALEAKEPSD